MGKFRIEKSLFGRETVYDENGKQIGTVDTTLFGKHVVRDSSGREIGTLTEDSLGRKILVEDNYSILTGRHRTTHIASDEPEDWEYNNEGDWDGGGKE